MRQTSIDKEQIGACQGREFGISRCKPLYISSVGSILRDPMNRSMPGLLVHHQLPEFIQTHVHRVGDAIQPSHPLLSPSPSALNLSFFFFFCPQSFPASESLPMSQLFTSGGQSIEFQLQHQSLQ